MKKIFLILLLANIALYAKEITNNELVQQLLREVTLLKKEVLTLKKSQHDQQILSLQKELNDLKKVQNEQIETIQEVAEHTDDIEAKSFQDKINFGLGLKTNLDNFTKKYADGHIVENDNIWSTKFMLNMKADIANNMNFYGRLSMYKYWGASITPMYDTNGRSPSDSALLVERAYINWFFNKNGAYPMALTIGRQPSSDGPSHQFKNNSTRKGTYSALLYDTASDGIVFTVNISKLLNNPKSYIRLGYSRGFTAKVDSIDNDIKDTDTLGLFFDTTVPNIDNSLIQLSCARKLDIVANPFDANSTQNTNIGSVDFYGAMVEFTNFKESNLDFFTHLGYSVAHPNSESYTQQGGLLSANGDNSNKSGYAVWIGSRYSFAEGQKYKIGAEYNHGSKNWINNTHGSFDLYNKLATRGDAYETYLMYVINRYSNIRLGYIYLNFNYTNSGNFLGESIKISSSLNNADQILQSVQSAYLKMNINY